MKILFDTNIILDWLLDRKPFSEASKKCIEKAKNHEIEGYITVHSLSDLFYLVHKSLNLEQAKEYINLVCNIFSVLTEDQNTVLQIIKSLNWIENIWNDIEDSLQIVSAELNRMDFILTRNPKDFVYSNVKSVLPEAFLSTIL